MDVSIILVSYNTKFYTEECIKSILEHTLNLDIEIIVVDNNSNDDSCKMIETTFPTIKLIKNKTNLGFGAANNIALKYCRGKYIFCLNTDTLLLNNVINILYEYMEANKNVAACGGQLFDENLKPGMSYFPFPTAIDSTSIAWLIKRINKYCFKLKQYNKNIGYINGADIFLKKEVLDIIGGFDEQFFMYYEEADLCKRILNEGYGISFLKNAKILHYGEKSSISYWNNLEQRVKSKYLFIKKHSSSFHRYLMKISFIILHSICYLFTYNNQHINMIKLHYYEH